MSDRDSRERERSDIVEIGDLVEVSDRDWRERSDIKSRTEARGLASVQHLNSLLH